MVDHALALPEGYQLQEYTITGLLGYGGFGITYSAHDKNLDKIVAIKEYLPSELAVRLDGSTVSAKSGQEKDNFEWGLERFLDEARAVAKFNHPNIIRIHRFFEQNMTGYIVMEFIEGRTLHSVLTEKGTLEEAEIRSWLWPIMEGLKDVHAAGYIHRDIKPQNIMMSAHGTPILLDFGAARVAMGGVTQSLTSIMTPGYAPLEQYQTKSNQGPWTDIYALGAVMYRCVTGDKPEDALNRVSDDSLEPPGQAGTYSSGLLNSIIVSLALKDSERPQSLGEWLEMLDQPAEEPTRMMPKRRTEKAVPLQPDVQSPPPQQPPTPPMAEGKSRSLKWLFVVVPLLLVVAAAGYWVTREESQPIQVVQQPETMQEGSLPQPEPAEVERDEPQKPAVQNKPVAVPYMGIKVNSAPPGASVFLDDVFAGRTPVSFPGFERGRMTTVRLELEGYQGAEQVVTSPDEGVVEVSLTLVKVIPKYALTIETDPADASVKILNIGLHYQPGMMLEPGRYQVEISRNGYVAEQLWLEVKNDDLNQHITLKTERYALTIDPDPPDASVKFLNVDESYRAGMMLEPGRYHVEVSHDGYATRTQWVELGKEALTQRVELQRAEYALTISTEPPDAEVRLVEPARNYQAGMLLVPGRYHVEVSRDGYVTEQQWLEIRDRDLSQRISLEAKYVAGKVLQDCAECPEIVVIPAGSFMMGSPSSEKGRESGEDPQHRVTISRRFALGKYEVTFEEYDAFSRATGKERSSDEDWGRERRPVINVSWYDAQRYTKWLSERTGKSYRLPSESEWEYAVRAGTSTAYWWGNDVGRNKANCEGCGSRWDDRQTAPVGSFEANPFGLHDTSGNVWEWAQDCWNESYEGAPSDGTAWIEGDCGRRVLRGGSWYNLPQKMRSASRTKFTYTLTINDTGFRVARDLPQ